MTQSTDIQLWFEAAKLGDIPSLEQLLAVGIDTNTRDEKENTALHLATKASHLETMSFLIAQGADLNATNDWLSTSLHLCERDIDAIRVLLEAGADPNLKDKDWDYPYYFAFYGSMSRELTELYIKHGANLTFYEK